MKIVGTRWVLGWTERGASIFQDFRILCSAASVWGAQDFRISGWILGRADGDTESRISGFYAGGL